MDAYKANGLALILIILLFISAISIAEEKTFTWEAIERASSYKVTICKDLACKEKVLEKNLKETTFKEGLLPGSYFFMLAPISTTGKVGYFSKQQNFIVRPTIPKLLTPIDGEKVTVVELKPINLTWEESKGSINYKVEIKNEKGKIAKFESQKNNFELKNLALGTYEWKIKAIFDATIESDFSLPNKFTVIPQAISLIAPQDKTILSWDDKTEFTFEWEKISNASNYTLNIIPNDKKEKPIIIETKENKYVFKNHILGEYKWSVHAKSASLIKGISQERAVTFTKSLPIITNIKEGDKIEKQEALSIKWEGKGFEKFKPLVVYKAKTGEKYVIKVETKDFSKVYTNPKIGKYKAKVVGYFGKYKLESKEIKFTVIAKNNYVNKLTLNQLLGKPSSSVNSTKEHYLPAAANKNSPESTMLVGINYEHRVKDYVFEIDINHSVFTNYLDIFSWSIGAGYVFSSRNLLLQPVLGFSSMQMKPTNIKAANFMTHNFTYPYIGFNFQYAPVMLPKNLILFSFKNIGAYGIGPKDRAMEVGIDYGYEFSEKWKAGAGFYYYQLNCNYKRNPEPNAEIIRYKQTITGLKIYITRGF